MPNTSVTDGFNQVEVLREEPSPHASCMGLQSCYSSKIESFVRRAGLHMSRGGETLGVSDCQIVCEVRPGIAELFALGSCSKYESSSDHPVVYPV